MTELSSEVICRKTQFHSNQNRFLGIEIFASFNKVFGLHPGLVDTVDLRLELFLLVGSSLIDPHRPAVAACMGLC